MTADDVDGDGFGRALDRLVSEAAAAEAVRARVQERTLRTVAEAEATFVGVALDHAERGAAVRVRTSAARSHRGAIVAVGRDFLVVRDGDRPPVVLPLAAVTSIRSPAGRSAERDPAGGRAAPLEVSLGGLLSELGADRPRVQVAVLGEDAVTGDVRAVGADVVTLRLDTDGRPMIHLRIAAILEVVLLDL